MGYMDSYSSDLKALVSMNYSLIDWRHLKNVPLLEQKERSKAPLLAGGVINAGGMTDYALSVVKTLS